MAWCAENLAHYFASGVGYEHPLGSSACTAATKVVVDGGLLGLGTSGGKLAHSRAIVCGVNRRNAGIDHLVGGHIDEQGHHIEFGLVKLYGVQLVGRHNGVKLKCGRSLAGLVSLQGIGQCHVGAECAGSGKHHIVVVEAGHLVGSAKEGGKLRLWKYVASL